MKQATLSLIILLSFSVAAWANCNQRIYDSIYRGITSEALTRSAAIKSPDEERAIVIERTDTIEKLRALCKGQRSSYELSKPQLPLTVVIP